jgi:hypothetical protein
MNFSKQKDYLNSIEKNVFTTFEKDFLKNEKIRDEDEVIEELINCIVQKQCMFHFKVPLGEDFYQAKNSALNALDCLSKNNYNGTQNIKPRKIGDWIRHVLKCLDRLLIVYLFDIKKKNLHGQYFNHLKERDIYRTFENLDGDLKIIGEKCNYIYTTRSELEHDLKNKVEGRIVFKNKSAKILRRKYDFVNAQCIDIFNILVPLYKEYYSEYCKKE